MMCDFPLTIFILVNECIASLHFGSGGTHGEFVNSTIHAPVGSNLNKGFEDRSLWFKFAKIDVIVDNLFIGVSGYVWKVVDARTPYERGYVTVQKGSRQKVNAKQIHRQPRSLFTYQRLWGGGWHPWCTVLLLQ
jgi:hypothetical protein